MIFIFQEAARLKAEGNDFFRADKFAEAAEAYSKAIEADPTEAALYSNRAACYASLDMWAEVPTLSPLHSQFSFQICPSRHQRRRVVFD